MPEISKIKVNGTEYDIASKGLELIGTVDISGDLQTLVDDGGMYTRTNKAVFDLFRQARFIHIEAEGDGECVVTLTVGALEDLYNDESENYYDTPFGGADIMAYAGFDDGHGQTYYYLMVTNDTYKCAERLYGFLSSGMGYTIKLYR